MIYNRRETVRRCAEVVGIQDLVDNLRCGFGEDGGEVFLVAERLGPPEEAESRSTHLGARCERAPPSSAFSSRSGQAPASFATTSFATTKEPVKLPQLNQIPALSNVNSTVTLEPNDKPIQLQSTKSPTIPNTKFNINASTTFSTIPSSYEALSMKVNDSDTISLNDFDFELDDAAIKDAVTLNKPKKVYKNDDATLWKPSNLNDKILSFDSKGERGRLVDAEATLLMVYLHVPFLRNDIKAGLANIVKLTQKLIPSESLPFGGLTSKLGQMSKLLNTVITNNNIDNESNNIGEDLFKMHEWEESSHSELWNKITSFDDNDDEKDNVLLNALTNDLKANPKLSNILQGDYIKPLSKLSLGFLVKEVLRTITFAQARRNQIKLLNSVTKKGNINDQSDIDISSSETINKSDHYDYDDKLRKYEKLTSYLSETISDDLALIYQGNKFNNYNN
jgi:hypothetical protein